MWILKRDGQGSQDDKLFYIMVGEHSVGRKGCHIQITGDISVSRQHAWFIVTQNGTSSTQVSLKDVSKYGCSVNGVKCQKSVANILKHDDKITFGTQDCSYRLRYEPLMVFASCLENAKKKEVKSLLSKLGGQMVSEWQDGCSYLVMEALSFTVKVIYALITCSPIVTSAFVDHFVQAVQSRSELPNPENYMPPIKEDLIDPTKVSFLPNKARKCIFDGKLFLFLDKKQYKRLEQAIRLAGGKTLLKETGGEIDDYMLTNKSTLVISMDAKSAAALSAVQRVTWLGHVGDVLKSCDRRPVAETEIGLAILHVSMDEYCNASIHRVPIIAKEIVSKTISTLDEMSQRINESQVFITEVPEKKPLSLTRDQLKPDTTLTTPHDMKKRSRSASDESQSLTFETPQSHLIDPKRRRISSTNITHVSQTPEAQFKQFDGPSISLHQKDCTSRNDPQTRLEDKSVISVSESTATGCKRKASPSSKNVTHISQSPASEKGEKQLKLTCSNVDVTHVSQTQESQRAVIAKDVSNRNTTHISQSQFSERGENHASDELAVIPESQTSREIIKVKETPSPHGVAKRRKISSPDVTHISDTERSFVAEPQRCLSRVGLLSEEETTLNESISDCPTDEALNGCAEGRMPVQSGFIRSGSRELNSARDASLESTGDLRRSTGTQEENQQHFSPKKNNDIRNARHDQEKTLSAQSLTLVASNASPGVSGWMSKKSFNMKKEKSEINLSMGKENIVHAIDSLDESRSGKTADIDSGPREIVVKTEQNVEYPADLMSVEKVKLVVERPVGPSLRQLHKKCASTLKNMKRFRKQKYPGDDSGLPRIIGGCDLVEFSSKTWNVRESEVEAMSQQDIKDREADYQFHYKPTNKRQKRR